MEYNIEGVTQLAHNCDDILSGLVKWDTTYKPRRVKIWPIIVVTDNIFSIPGFNQILNNWFQEYLDKEIGGINKNQIQPLTVISLDTLLYFPSNKVKEMDKLLSGYSNHLYPKQFIGSKPLTEKEASIKYQESMNPFDLVEASIKYQESMNPFDLVLANRTKVNWDKLISEKISSLRPPEL